MADHEVFSPLRVHPIVSSSWLVVCFVEKGRGSFATVSLHPHHPIPAVVVMAGEENYLCNLLNFLQLPLVKEFALLVLMQVYTHAYAGLNTEERDSVSDVPDSYYICPTCTM
jgi:hypothetical protein